MEQGVHLGDPASQQALHKGASESAPDVPNGPKPMALRAGAASAALCNAPSNRPTAVLAGQRAWWWHDTYQESAPSLAIDHPMPQRASQTRPPEPRHHPWEPVLSQNPWYATLPQPLRDDLLAQASQRLLEPEQRLFRRGDPPSGLYAVLQGTLRISAFSGSADNPREIMLSPLLPGAWFGEISLFDHGPCTHDAYASTASRVLHCAQPALESLLERKPQYWRHLGCLMSDRLRNNLEFTERMLSLPMRARMAYRILQLADGVQPPATPGKSPPPWCVNVTQHEMAALLGCTRQTVNALLGELQELGWLQVKRGRLLVLNAQALAQEAHWTAAC